MIIGISGYICSGKDTVGKIIQDLTTQKFDWAKSIPYKESSWKIKKFAGKLKQMVSLLTGIPVEDLEKQEVKDSLLGPEWNYMIDGESLEGHKYSINQYQNLQPYQQKGYIEKKLSVRELLQQLGTNAVRDVIHSDAWVNALFADYKSRTMHQGKGKYTIRCMRCQSIMMGVSKYQRVCVECAKNIIAPNWIITDVRFPNEAQAIKDRGGIVIRVNRDYKLSGGPEDPSKLHSSETSLDNWEFDEVIENNGTIDELVTAVKGVLGRREIIV